jgi:hypothetical protein
MIVTDQGDGAHDLSPPSYAMEARAIICCIAETGPYGHLMRVGSIHRPFHLFVVSMAPVGHGPWVHGLPLTPSDPHVLRYCFCLYCYI